ncbi:MAG: glycosyltransferase [Pseudomonadota bacterium]
MPRKKSRVLIYSHDTFGLGHLRRCREIAHALVDRYKDLSVLILSGSPIIGSFDFKMRVDFVRIPGVIKLRNGGYTSLGLHIDVTQTLSMRASIIRHTADAFRPDVFIVDKEALGLGGEVKETLKMLKEQGTRLVLGLRDVLDEPKLLAPEWRRKRVVPALRDLYDEIWVYGLQEIYDTFEGIVIPGSVRGKITYMGYLPRHVPTQAITQELPELTTRPYLLVTTGGGGDGDQLIDAVLRAYEHDKSLPYAALLVLGPFMAPELRAGYQARAAKLDRVEVITFHNSMETLVAQAVGVVAMGGYNTFCEILSLDKRALIVPRTVPRLEQHIRASRAAELGLVSMLAEDQSLDPRMMSAALRALPHQKAPSEAIVPGLLRGSANIARQIAPWLGGGKPARAAGRRSAK